MKSVQFKVCGISAWVAALAVGVTPQVAEAAIVSVGSFNVGPVFSLDPSSPESAAGFLLGENVLLSFTIDDTVADTEPGIGTAAYLDPNGEITLTGETSGASVVYAGGVDLDFDDNEEFEIDNDDSVFADASATVTPILEGDIDFDTLGTPFFTDVDDLALTLLELQTIPFPNQSTNTAFTQFFNGLEPVTGMEFGPVPRSVPEPSTALGAIALGGFLWKRRKLRKNVES